MGWAYGQDYDYYERGNMDIFPICSMELVSDGTGPHHGWYCNYVEVTSTGPHIQCAQQLFTVEQCLATDRSPHELTAVRDNCNDCAGVKQRRRISELPVETLLAAS